MDGNRPFSYNGGKGDTSGTYEDESVESISIEQLRQLVRLLDRTDVSEIELKRADDGMRLVLRKARVPQSTEQGMQQVATSAKVAVEADNASSIAQHFVLAQLVGIFHPWAKPKGGTLVAIGDRVKQGQLVATIQSLNVMNEVEAPVGGRVSEILVQDGQAVEYGQQLMLIDSNEGT